jgi:ParB family chromosome partitioning protein
LFPGQTQEGEPPETLVELADRVVAVGGVELCRFREPLGGRWQLLAALPIERVRPSPFQRDLSDAHVKKLMAVMARLARYLDPIVVVPDGSGGFRTPNGNHRLAAMRRLGARTVVAVVVAEAELEYSILALNTEKAPGLKDRAAEVVRLAQTLAEAFDPDEPTFADQFEDPSLLTLGLAYAERARLAGSTYHPLLKKCEGFIEAPLSESLAVRHRRAQRVLELDDAVESIVERLRARGFESPYLKTVVVARLNPLPRGRRSPAGPPDFDAAFDRVLARARDFDVSKVDGALLSADG